MTAPANPMPGEEIVPLFTTPVQESGTSFLAFLLIRLFLPAIVLLASPAFAHVGADDMPDAVAEVEYSIFLEFQPKDTVIRNKLGMVYYRLNKYKEAVREFSRILKQDPDNYDALDGMGLVRAAQGEYDEAIDLHRRAIGLNDEDMMGYFHLGSALEKKGRLPEAMEAYQAARARYSKQYPQGTDNKQAVEFGRTLEAAIAGLETRL
ncbi:MAG: tetratricopeptide repeat protein [Desulfobulbus sp.]|nr:MAG: tetratricopeptide repeat protein [Desulfobulbus sp.]